MAAQDGIRLWNEVRGKSSAPLPLMCVQLHKDAHRASEIARRELLPHARPCDDFAHAVRNCRRAGQRTLRGENAAAHYDQIHRFYRPHDRLCPPHAVSLLA